MAAPCADPGVDADVDIALIETRRAWAVCAERHAAAVKSYEDVRREIGKVRP